MASYTEYFYEYIENGNEMSSNFDDVLSINGKIFKDMFKTHFNAYEISQTTKNISKN